MGYDLVCRDCGRHTEQDVFRCPHCNGILDCRFELEDPPQYRSILQGAKGFWDYLPFFPVAGGHPVSLGEGNTPLVAAPRLAGRLEMRGVYVKNEGMNPSGTFKDRCQSIAYTKAREMGAPATIIGSAGNAGAAAAAYAAASGIPCFVVVPADTNMERLAQTLQYGANLIRVQGNVSDCIEMLEAVCKARGWQDMTTAHSHNPFQRGGGQNHRLRAGPGHGMGCAGLDHRTHWRRRHPVQHLQGVSGDVYPGADPAYAEDGGGAGSRVCGGGGSL